MLADSFPNKSLTVTDPPSLFAVHIRVYRQRANERQKCMPAASTMHPYNWRIFVPCTVAKSWSGIRQRGETRELRRDTGQKCFAMHHLELQFFLISRWCTPKNSSYLSLWHNMCTCIGGPRIRETFRLGGIDYIAPEKEEEKICFEKICPQKCLSSELLFFLILYNDNFFHLLWLT